MSFGLERVRNKKSGHLNLRWKAGERVRVSCESTSAGEVGIEKEDVEPCPRVESLQRAQIPRRQYLDSGADNMAWEEKPPYTVVIENS